MVKVTFTTEVVTEEPKPKLIPIPQDYNSIGSYPPPLQKLEVLNEWGLKADLNLQQELTAFYLLYEASILADKEHPDFKAKLDLLEEQFSLYTDMVIGGEIRHLKVAGTYGWDALVPMPLHKALKSGTIDRHNRHKAWGGWRKFRLQHGTAAIRWLEDAFLQFKGHGYGGPPWSKIAQVLRMYETKVLSPMTFVDTCWGLQHNNGSYFNKVWSVHNITTLLDYVRKGNSEELKKYAEPDILIALQEWK